MIEAEQSPAVEGISRFEVPLQFASELGFVPGLGCYLEGRVSDFFGRTRQVRIYHTGHSPAWLGLRKARRYPRVSLLSFDGIRLRLVYGAPEIRVASVYLTNPAQLYSLEATHRSTQLDFRNLPWTPLQSYRVELKRDLERQMIRSHYRYPHGRIGSEIAYSIASREMGIPSLRMNDPSEGGADMMTKDGRAIFENRLVTITEAMSKESSEQQMVFQLRRMMGRLRSDLAFYRSAEVGYAFLSYVGADGLDTVIFEMKR